MKHANTIFILATSVLATVAHALPIPADHLLGNVLPGTPATETNHAEQVEFLVKAYNDGEPTGTNLGNNTSDPQAETYWLLYTPGVIPNPAPLVTSAVKVDSSNPDVDITGWHYDYILGFFGSNSAVWWIGDLTGHIDLIAPWGTRGGGLSHYVLVNGREIHVPDGASTLALLGLGFAGIAFAARRRKA